jgi:uncharacterized protein YkwD
MQTLGLALLMLALSTSCGGLSSTRLKPAAAAPRPGTDTALEPPTRETGAAERRLFDLVNAARRRAGLGALEWDERAAAVARGHSREMRERCVVAHVSPATGTPADRVHRAGIHVPLVLENVGRAGSVSEAHAGFMNSPGHRANILSPEATHLGIGIAPESARGAFYVTELFLQRLGRLDLASARTSVRQAILARRRAQGLRNPSPDTLLDAVAQRLAEAFAEFAGEVPASRRQAVLTPALERYATLHTTMAIVSDPCEVASDAGVLAGGAALGIGVAQGAHAELGANAAYVIVLLGEAR